MSIFGRTFSGHGRGASKTRFGVWTVPNRRNSSVTSEPNGSNTGRDVFRIRRNPVPTARDPGRTVLFPWFWGGWQFQTKVLVFSLFTAFPCVADLTRFFHFKNIQIQIGNQMNCKTEIWKARRVSGFELKNDI